MFTDLSSTFQPYLSFKGSLPEGKLDNKIAVRIALFIAENNYCDYCLSEHSVKAKQAGLSSEEISSAREGYSADIKANAALVFVIALIDNGGKVKEKDLEIARNAGLCDEQLLQIISAVSLNNRSKSLNNFIQTSDNSLKVPQLTECSCGSDDWH